MTDIHPTAVVSPKARLGTGVTIGAYSVIEGDVTIGHDTIISPHVVITGHTTLGERNRIYQFTSIGTPPQDISYKGEDTTVEIGDDNVIREYVTINRATTKEQWRTVMGNRNYIMAYAHIAHDCVLGDNVIMSNCATLGGHIRVGDRAILGGLVAVHQFVRVGAYAFLGGKSGVDRDVPPYMMTAGPRAKLYGVNRKGLRRAGFPNATIDALKMAYRIIWRENKRLSEGIRQVQREVAPIPEVKLLLNFLIDSKRGVLR